jgi:hypothetical protein
MLKFADRAGPLLLAWAPQETAGRARKRHQGAIGTGTEAREGVGRDLPRSSRSDTGSQSAVRQASYTSLSNVTTDAVLIRAYRQSDCQAFFASSVCPLICLSGSTSTFPCCNSAWLPSDLPLAFSYVCPPLAASRSLRLSSSLSRRCLAISARDRHTKQGERSLRKRSWYSAVFFPKTSYLPWPLR